MSRSIFIYVFAALSMVSGPTIAAQAQTVGAVDAISPAQTFVKKRYSVKGQWEVLRVDGKDMIRFSDEFKTKNGPDLKVYLSPRKLEDVTKETATEGSLKIGVLKSNKGEQLYTIPDDVTLADYESLLIHCEAFSVLWGGFDIPK